MRSIFKSKRDVLKQIQSTIKSDKSWSFDELRFAHGVFSAAHTWQLTPELFDGATLFFVEDALC